MKFYITTKPDKPYDQGCVIIEAVNQLDALDKYAVQERFAPYSDSDELDQFIGVDEHGLWAIFTNYRIYAIPYVEPKNVPVAQLRFEGLTISASRNRDTGQHFVLINTDDFDDADQDEDGDPYIEIVLNDATLHDREK